MLLVLCAVQVVSTGVPKTALHVLPADGSAPTASGRVQEQRLNHRRRAPPYLLARLPGTAPQHRPAGLHRHEGHPMHLHLAQRRSARSADDAAPEGARRLRRSVAGVLQRLVLVAAGIAIGVLLVRLVQLQLAGMRLRAVLDRGPDAFLSAELRWGQAEAAQLTLVAVSLGLMLAGAGLLHLSRRR